MYRSVPRLACRLHTVADGDGLVTETETERRVGTRVDMPILRVIGSAHDIRAEIPRNF